ncbi:MAG: hypothetical protein HUU38_15100 [Anaerolineales bacterium]|nr:hypothetical protein [Anaerolineales bacterium]
MRARPELGHRFCPARPAMKSPGYKTTPDEFRLSPFQRASFGRTGIDACASPARIGTPFLPSPPGRKHPGYKTMPDESGSARFNGRRVVTRALIPVRVRPELGHRFCPARPAMKSPGYKTTPDEFRLSPFQRASCGNTGNSSPCDPYILGCPIV